jgi:hypothetical protein
MAIKHTNIFHYQYISPKFTQSVIFGFKINHLATLRTIESFADMSEKEFANICKPLHVCMYVHQPTVKVTQKTFGPGKVLSTNERLRQFYRKRRQGPML